MTQKASEMNLWNMIPMSFCLWGYSHVSLAEKGAQLSCVELNILKRKWELKISKSSSKLCWKRSDSCLHRYGKVQVCASAFARGMKICSLCLRMSFGFLIPLERSGFPLGLAYSRLGWIHQVSTSRGRKASAQKLPGLRLVCAIDGICLKNQFEQLVPAEKLVLCACNRT